MRRRARVAAGEAANYREKAKGGFNGRCDWCDEPVEWDDTQVHHTDRNRANDDGDNLDRLCWSCHQEEHHGDSPLWGLLVEMPRPVLDLVDEMVESRSMESRHEAVNRAVVAYATLEEADSVSKFSAPEDSVSAWFGDGRHRAWSRDVSHEI